MAMKGFILVYMLNNAIFELPLELDFELPLELDCNRLPSLLVPFLRLPIYADHHGESESQVEGATRQLATVRSTLFSHLPVPSARAERDILTMYRVRPQRAKGERARGREGERARGRGDEREPER